jgi:hypothetical protein
MSPAKPQVRGQGLPRRRFTHYALLYFIGLVVAPVFAAALALDGILYWMAGRVIQGCYSVFCLL